MPGDCSQVDPRGAGGVPLDTARSPLVSNLFVGETPRAMARRVGLCRGAMAQGFEGPFIMLPKA